MKKPQQMNGGLRHIFYALVRRRWRFRDVGDDVYVHWQAQFWGAHRISLGNAVEIGSHVLMRTTDGDRGIEIGNHTVIHPYVIIDTQGGSVSLGSNCSVNPFSILYGHGGLHVGDNTRIAAHTVIIPAQHIFDSLERPIYEQGVSRKGITIGEDVWIGAGVSILDGVLVGNGAVIGVGAVVNGEIPAGAIAVGVPARVVRMRGCNLDHG